MLLSLNTNGDLTTLLNFSFLAGVYLAAVFTNKYAANVQSRVNFINPCATAGIMEECSF